MRERKRRWLCRIGFGGICLIPTLLVVLLVTSRWLPTHTHHYETRISAHLGLVTSIQRVNHPRPGVTLLHELTLEHPETSGPLMSAELVEISRVGGRIHCIISQPRIEAPHLPLIYQTLHDRLTAKPEPWCPHIRLASAELMMRDHEDSHRLTDVQMGCEPIKGGPQAFIQFKVAGFDMPDPIHIRYRRHRETRPAASRLDLHTGGSALPCSILAPCVAALGSLGSDCQFRGAIWTTRNYHGWQGQASGRATGMNLDRLISQRFPHKLNGTANLVLQNARWEDGRLIEASGRLSASGGVISRSLLNAAVQNLYLRYGRRPEGGDSPLVKYEQLSLGFLLDSSGLTLNGLCENAAIGTVIRDKHDSLLLDPVQQPVPVVHLVRMLVPFHQVQVPATQQTDMLLHVLPIPTLVTPTTHKSHHRSGG